MANARNILITGGTDGIGLKLVHHYIENGDNVVVTGRRREQDAVEILPKGAHYIMADQSKPENAAHDILAGLQAINWKSCDLAILNAGTGFVCAPLEELPNTLSNTINVNLEAPIAITHALAPILLETPNAKLVFIGSTSHKGAANFASYSASKSGLNGFARSLRQEWQDRVDVQIIHPGPTATQMHSKAGFAPGPVKHIFLNPDFVCRAIARKIERGGSPISISFLARIKDYVFLRHRVSS